MLQVLDLGSASQVHRQWQKTFSEPGSFSPAQVRSYWENLFLDLNLPRDSNANLSVGVPCCYDCLTRSMIMDILTQRYGFNQIKLIPRSLALVYGYLALHPEAQMSGDWVCVLADEDNLDFSFISISASCINLELQGVGSWVNLQEEAGRLGLLNTQEWNINQLLYVNLSPSASLNLPILELGNDVTVLKAEDLSNTILRGLSCWSAVVAAKEHRVFSMIYPYDYYLERSFPPKKRLIREQLSFDTSNLELDLNGSYKLASLATTSLYLDPEDSYVNLAVYEAERDPFPLNPFICAPVMELRLNMSTPAACLDFWLDMESASIFLERNGQRTILPVSLANNILLPSNENQLFLARLLEGSSNQNLPADLAHDLLTKYGQESCNELAAYLKTIQLKLYGLLELWSSID